MMNDARRSPLGRLQEAAATLAWRWLFPVQVILLVGVVSFVIGVMGTLTLWVLRGDAVNRAVTVAPSPGSTLPVYYNPPLPTAISPIFTPEVQHWAPQIVAWSKAYDIDPNMLATVVQIESCGDWQAGSSAGAQGLFQVMPFHFQEGENPLDPETNAKAGITYLKQSLEAADGHFGLALAGYNGGIGIISAGWARWAAETRRYYLWGSGIYEDAVQGAPTSDALVSWLNAGGSILCNQAALRIASTPSALAANTN